MRPVPLANNDLRVVFRLICDTTRPSANPLEVREVEMGVGDALDGVRSLAHTPIALAAFSNCSSRTYTRYPKEPRPSVTPEDA